MHGRTISLAVAAGLVCAGAAQACEALTDPLTTWLESRRPLLGEDVRLTSGFGMRRFPPLMERRLHAGVDWAAPTGTPIIAAAGGRVIAAAVSDELGNTILIDHGAGWQTVYGHLSAFDARQGDCVAFGTIIGKVGSTGFASGPALHFEVRREGRPIDPLSLTIKNAPPDEEEK